MKPSNHIFKLKVVITSFIFFVLTVVIALLSSCGNDIKANCDVAYYGPQPCTDDQFCIEQLGEITWPTCVMEANAEKK